MAQFAHDELRREQISDSCAVIRRHASFIGVTASEVANMPRHYEPPCMDDLDETEGVLRRALAKIEAAKATLKTKEAA